METIFYIYGDSCIDVIANLTVSHNRKIAAYKADAILSENRINANTNLNSHLLNKREKLCL